MRQSLKTWMTCAPGVLTLKVVGAKRSKEGLIGNGEKGEEKNGNETEI